MTEEPGTLTVAFVPTVDDQVRANREILRRSRWERVLEIALVLFLGRIVVLTVWRFGWRELFGSAMLPAIVLAALLVLTFGMPALVRWSIVRQRRQNPHLVGAITLTFSGAGVHVQSPLGTMDVPWTSFVRARETPELLLLCFARKAAYFVPRRALRETDEARLRALVSAHLGARAELMKPTDDR
ncbi:MAG TPA: YcxB family protein [Longimicrobium sp.]|nr:YcxB family protein [Longimicrobium sp.]